MIVSKFYKKDGTSVLVYFFAHRYTVSNGGFETAFLKRSEALDYARSLV